jgi:hypothetical protein
MRRRWHQFQEWWQRRSGTERLEISFQGIIAIATLFYVTVALFQWNEMKGQLVEMRTQLTMDQRAWIQIKHNGNLSDTFEVPIRVLNSGKTPAKQVTTDLVAEFVPKQNAPSFRYETQTNHMLYPMMFAAGSFDLTATPHTKPPLSLQQSWASGEVYIAVFGKATYRDDFGWHWTHFCWWTAETSVTGHFNAGSCTEYNDVGDGKEPSQQ